ncbi:hypothetical protein GCM10008942_33270 [Rhizomicrobium electricum]|uniref:Uncharacterized protein n=1 Tax=Rhizomicrobium electricum TaxID=480070 RepID=A0ABP3Q704_9PROT
MSVVEQQVGQFIALPGRAQARGSQARYGRFVRRITQSFTHKDFLLTDRTVRSSYVFDSFSPFRTVRAMTGMSLVKGILESIVR